MFSQSPFDKLLDKATSPDSLEVNWGDFMTICDFISSDKIQPKAALNSIKKKISHHDPHVSLYAVQLLDACVSNCGKSFHLEICSREFENDLMKFLSKGHPKVIEKLKEYIKRWSEQEFKNDPQLILIPALYNKLKQEGVKFTSSEVPKRKIELPSDPNFVSCNQEEEDIAKAIELSLKDSSLPKNYNSKVGSSESSLYPSINNSYPNNSKNDLKEPFKVKALYDFEAAEDNEITFKAGDILLVIDDRNSNWWKGSNYKGEGIFPACFVTKNLNEETEVPNKNIEKKAVKFNEETNVKAVNIEKKIEIDETKIDRLLYLLHEADPTDERPDSEELIQLEEQCFKMGPLIDQELEIVDKTHASLSTVNSQLVEALNIYCSLMKGSSTYSPVQTPYAQAPNYQMVQNYPNGMNYPKIQYVNQPQCSVIQTPTGHTMASYANNTSVMNEPSYNQVYNDPNLVANSGIIHYTDLNSQIPVYSQQQMPTSTINTNALSNPISSTAMQNPVMNNSQQQMINQSSYTPQ